MWLVHWICDREGHGTRARTSRTAAAGGRREFLEDEEVPYSVHSHPEAYTALEIAALEHVKGRMLAEVVIVRTGAGDLVMVVVPADRRVDFRKVGALLGSARRRTGQRHGGPLTTGV